MQALVSINLYILSTPLNWDTFVPGSFSQLTENLTVDGILGLFCSWRCVTIKRSLLSSETLNI